MSTDMDNVQPNLRRRGLGARVIWLILAVFVLCGICFFVYFNKSENQDLSIPGKFAGERRTVVIKGAVFSFRWCPAGSFLAGSPESEGGRAKDEIQHNVTLTSGFWMLESEVTQKQWKAIMGANPSNFKGDNLPVEQVSWNDCQEFCKKCTELGLPVQLPTDAQWEYACRAGGAGLYAGNLDEMAWYFDNSGGKTHSVASKTPNAWGLYDMHGNVSEWCADWYGDYPSESVTDPTGPQSGSDRIVRGGSWNRNAVHCRSARRRLDNPAYRYYDLGFRVVRPIASSETPVQQTAPEEQASPAVEPE